MTEKASFKVCSKMCDQCLFTKNKIVSDSRAAQVIRECLENDRFFICHKTENTCCRGFYNAHRLDIWPIRLALRLDGVEFVDLGDEADNGK